MRKLVSLGLLGLLLAQPAAAQMSGPPLTLSGGGSLNSPALDRLFGSTQGTLIYRGASAWSALTPPASAFYVLNSSGAGNGPAWATSFSVASVGVTGSVPPTSGFYRPAGIGNGVGFSTQTTAAGWVDGTQHWRLGGSGTPTLSLTASTCGTAGTITGNDHSGVITVGTSSGTSCTVTFASTPTSAPRACLISPANATAGTYFTSLYVPAPTTSGFTLTGTSASLSGVAVSYLCL